MTASGCTRAVGAMEAEGQADINPYDNFLPAYFLNAGPHSFAQSIGPLTNRRRSVSSNSAFPGGQMVVGFVPFLFRLPTGLRQAHRGRARHSR